MNLGNADSAGRWVTRIEPLLSADAAGALALGQAWLTLSQRQGAPVADRDRSIDYLRRAIEDPACHAAAAQALGEAAHAAGDLARAQRYYLMAIEDRPDNASALNNLAVILAADPSKRGESIALARRAVEVGRALRPVPKRCRDFYETLATALLKDGQCAEAEKMYREGLRLDPAAPDLNVGLAESALAQGRRQDAQAVLRTLDSIEPDRSNLSEPLKQRLVALRRSLAPNVAK
jgi:Flp pilus assembly protein TadD